MSSAPIPKFRVIPGWPETMFPGVVSDRKQRYFWSQFERDWINGSNGRFEKTLDSSVVYGVATNRYAFKVEADGYKAFVTRIINEGETNVELDIALQRGGSSMLTILAPNGQPSPDTDVVFPREHGFVRLGARGILRNGGANDIRLTDSKGQIALPSDEPAKIVAAGPAGFAMIDFASLPADGTIRLQPWGRVEGRISRRGKPIADWKLHIGADYQRDHIHLQAGETISDTDGRFTIQYTPPGQMKLVRMVRADEPNTFTDSPIRDVQIIPGETANADYEQQGVVANVRIRFPAGFTRTPEHRIFCGAHIPYPQPTREEMADPAALARWRERPEVKAVITKMRGAQFFETEGGVWSTENLEPGDWLVTVSIIEQKPNPPIGQIQPLLTGSLKIQIPENPSEEKLDLGEITLAPPPVTQ
jgi:hypothetical protein